MNRVFRTIVVGMILFSMLGSQSMFSAPVHKVEASPSNHLEDVFIYQNVVPDKAELNDGTIVLKGMNIYKNGHFTLTENMEWKSYNKKVATVNENGEVTVTGNPGKTFIKGKSGKHSDKIAIQTKKNGKDKATTEIIPIKKDRYHIVEKALENMSLEEKVGQMLMPDFRKWEGKDVTKMLPEIEEMVKRYHLGGVILFRENVVSTEQTTRLVDSYQKASEKYGLLVTIDQEGGIVTRLQSGTDMPGNMALGATRSKELTYNVGQVIGKELKSLGINMNLAPVMDVNNNPDNPVIGVRSFGEEPKLVSELGVSYIKGIQSQGVAATAKHFPGHGDTALDSHIGLPEVPYDIERLEQVELYPFQQAMDEGVDAVMTAHVTFPKIDDTKVISKKTGEKINLPATLSPKVLTGLMRERMGYEGVIYTDALNMNAIADHFGSVDAAIRAVKAGTDILLMPVGVEKVAEGLLDAVESGEITEERLNQSVKRILKLKLDKGIIKKEEPTPVQEKIQAAEETVGAKSHKQIEQQAADRSITLIKNEEVLPLEKEKEEIVVIGRSFQKELFESVSQHQSNVTSISLDSDYDLSEEEWDKVKKADVIIVGTYTYNVSTRAKDSNQMQMVREVMNNTEGHVIGVGIRNPYDIMAYPEIDAFVAQYGFRKASFDATAKVIFGETSPSGALPVTILDDSGEVLYPYGHRVNADKEEEEEEFFQLGVEKFLEEHKDLVKGKKVGLITNPTGVDQQLRSVVDTLHEDEGVQLTALYGPEHGVRGSAQAGDYVESYTDEKTGLPVYSLYGETRKPTKEMLENVDTLLFDIQDVGTRFYTYIYTMALAMEAAGENDIEFVVLDRPNPLSGDKVEGPVLNPEYSSFVGKYPIPLRHGMTVGELAQLFNEEYKLGADLKVIQMDQYDRGMSYKDTGLEFVMPSPNMPTLDTAMVYPGAALIEGTNVSEGRGTTRPFELIGAPFIESTAIAAALNEQQLPGVRFRASSFTPSFSKYEGELVHGVQIHVTNPNTYQPVKTGLHVVKIIHDQYPEQFAFRAEDSQGVSFFDKLIGNGWVRQAIEDGKSVDYMVEKWKKELDEFKELREEYLLYE